MSGPGFALRGDATKSVTITGIEPETYFDVIALPRRSSPGATNVGPLDIIIGTELAKDLGATVGDKLRARDRDAAPLPTLTVTGIFDFGNKGVNERNVYVALRSAQNLLDLVGGASSIEVKVRDPFAAETIAQTIRASDRPQGRQLDQDQRAVLHRDGGADPRQHADPHLRRAHGRARHRERAGGVGGAEIQGDRHPARDGHRRAARCCACS